ncbi:MAG: hypothetical protein ACPL07_02105 [Candidatus Bathyarchaeia archaeon]
MAEGVCPVCGSRIDFLEYSGREFVRACFTVGEGGEAEYICWETVDVDGGSMEYRCPKCYNVIASNEKDALKVFK